MPCFGTSDRTYRNALELMRLLGVTVKEIDIRTAVTTHLRDIGHDLQVRDATYENVQARERTQVLMDYAGQIGALVVGTGDLSELALGWCTYNGDHMSMYSVNASIPKTVIPEIIRSAAKKDFPEAEAVLADIVATPISPELLPPDAQGQIAQHTEELIGPYALHDFFLYYMLTWCFPPEKIYALACRAFAGAYSSEEIRKWLRLLYRRFFSQQFKRNCQPDGVKATEMGFSPRGDWQMPSDVGAKLWLNELGEA
jgi:NAD+ synthase (glutamine-hydrolysing)